MFTFEHPRGGENRVSRNFWSNIGLLQWRPDLTAKGRYSDVDRDVIDVFFARVMGDETAENAEQLRALCDELGFAGFDDEIHALLGGDWKVRRDLVGLRGRVDRHDVVIEELQWRVLELEQQLRDQRGVPERVEAVARRVEENRSDVEGAVADARREASALREDVERLRSIVGEKASSADVAALSEEVARLKRGRGASDRERRRGCDSSRARSKTSSLFVYDEARPLDGIIAHLTRVCGGNVHEEDVITVTASSVRDGEPEYVVDLTASNWFSTDDLRDSWICYDFGRRRRVALTSYSIMSYPDAPGGYHPKSWVLEVSNASTGRTSRVFTEQSGFSLATRSIHLLFHRSGPCHLFLCREFFAMDPPDISMSIKTRRNNSLLVTWDRIPAHGLSHSKFTELVHLLRFSTVFSVAYPTTVLVA